MAQIQGQSTVSWDVLIFELFFSRTSYLFGPFSAYFSLFSCYDFCIKRAQGLPILQEDITTLPPPIYLYLINICQFYQQAMWRQLVNTNCTCCDNHQLEVADGFFQILLYGRCSCCRCCSCCCGSCRCCSLNSCCWFEFLLQSTANLSEPIKTWIKNDNFSLVELFFQKWQFPDSLYLRKLLTVGSKENV